MAGKITKLPTEEPEQPALYAEIAEMFNVETENMDREELVAFFEKLLEQRDALDELEPKKKRSDAYEDWAELHEYLEDLMDEIQDALDELEP